MTMDRDSEQAAVVPAGHDQGNAPPEERFKNRKQAHAWLQGEGYKVSRGKFYADCDAGALLVAPDGSLSKFRVLDYARKLRRPPLAPDLAAGDLAQEKLLWEVRRLKNEVRKQDLALRAEDRQWMAQTDHERRISLLVIRLGELYAYHGHLAAPEICALAGGDPAAAGQVVDRLKVLLDAVFQDLRGAVMGEVFFGETDADDQPEGEDE